MNSMFIWQALLFLKICEVVVSGNVIMNADSKRCWTPNTSANHPAEGSTIIHTSKCREQSAFFRILPKGAIQHEQSGMCIHLSGNRKNPKNREKAILRRDCDDSKYFFTYTSSKTFQLNGKCLRPNSIRWPERTELLIFSGCGKSETIYNIVDVVQGCDLVCLGNLIKFRKSSNSFNDYFTKSESEAKSLSSVSSTFFSTLKTETPELYKDLLSTFFPVDPNVIQNLEKLIQHFGLEKTKSYPSLFLAAAFIKRKQGVDKSKPSVCGGIGLNIGGIPAVDQEDAEYKLSLRKNELAVVLDEEDNRAREVIDKEREADEKSGNTGKFKVSNAQKLIDHLEAKYYYKYWTPESLTKVMQVCGVSDPNQIKFPPRGFGMSGIDYLEYLLSRNETLLPQENLKFPWPLAIALDIETPLRQCKWIWRRLEEGEKIVRYSKYTWDYRLNKIQCKDSDWNPCSIPRIIEDGGVCGRQSTLARVTNHCLGIASGPIKQPAHAAGYTYVKLQSGYKFQLFQSITSMMNTYTIWYLNDFEKQPGPKVNAEYHQGLANAMNHGYESYRNGRIALLIFSRIYNSSMRHESRELLVEALETNPHMMDIWMKLIHDVTGSIALPVEGPRTFNRLPWRCPRDFNNSQRNRLIVLMNKHLKSYMQMYLEVLLRLISPPSCCSENEPKYLDTLTTALKSEKREVIREYLFDVYLLCATKSSNIPDFINIVQKEILSDLNSGIPEFDPFSQLLKTVGSFLKSKRKSEVEENREIVETLYNVVCDPIPRLHVTLSAWVILPQYKVCKEEQLDFLDDYISASYDREFKEWQALQDDSAKDVEVWNKFYLKGWLYGRSGDIVPLLVGARKSVNGALITESKVNMAKSKPTAMSSAQSEERSSDRAVDGSSDHDVAGGSCASTTRQGHPWFRVDLGKPTKIHGVLISNAEGKYGKYLNSFKIHVGNSLDENGVINAECGNLHAVRPGETRVFYCDPPLNGQYVTINIPASSAILTLCEVAVYDSELANYRAHGVRWDIWHNIRSRKLQTFYDDPRYPNQPDEDRILDTFDYKNKGGNFYGARLSALYQAPVTGNYTFYAACNKMCEVFLRDPKREEQPERIISLLKTTRYKNWSKYKEQKSSPILLEKGKYYELVATLKEDTGYDFITLGMKTPSGKFVAPIPSEYLFIETKQESTVVV